MRIVEPNSFKAPVKTNNKRKNKLSKILFFIAIIISVGAYVSAQKQVQEVTNNETLKETVVQENTDVEELPKGTLRTFSGNEFRIFYDNLRQPNQDKVDVPPSISGNDIADARIRQIALRRGYRLRSNPTVKLPVIDGFNLQQSVHQPWIELKGAAAQDGLTMSIVSAFRSVEDQRGLFLSRLKAEGVNIEDVANGLADVEIDTVLVTSSIPGYSKHHTGYTFDLLCAGFAFENFKDSPCQTWISANNYEKAKIYGFIPSYPPDADLQGPAPEAWEYVWVDAENLYVN